MWRKKHKQVNSFLSLNRVNGGSYVIQSCGLSETNKYVITFMEGEDRLGLEKWQKDFVKEKIFVLQPCTDVGHDWIITLYDTQAKQWYVENDDPDKPAILEVQEYPFRGDERLRPPLGQWRFIFEDAKSFGPNKYRIANKNTMCEVADKKYLQFCASDNTKLEFASKSDDPSQIWGLCFY